MIVKAREIGQGDSAMGAPRTPDERQQEQRDMDMGVPFVFVDEIETAGRRCLVRLDLNVPLAGGGVADDTRIQRILAGLQALRERGARLILMTHLGRPGGKAVPGLSLAPVAARLSELLGCDVPLIDEITGEVARRAALALGDGDVVMLENLRFHPGEEANDATFAGALSRLGEVYIGDAFSCTHRAHASVEALPGLMDEVAAGRALGEELRVLHATLKDPARPLGAVIGGAKVSTKLEVLKNLISRVDVLVLGGGMANTFLLSDGIEVGASLVERDMVAMAKDISLLAGKRQCNLVLPCDFVLAKRLEAGVETRIAGPGDVGPDEMILDVGPKSIAAARSALLKCKTVVWNGPMGAFEVKPFDDSTNQLAKVVADASGPTGIMSVAGGGDTLSALANAGVSAHFSYISTAGGAFLEWLEGRNLPGVQALLRKA